MGDNAQTPGTSPGVTTIIAGLEAYMRGCPLLERGAFRIDALGPKPVEYCVETDIFEPVIQHYINGDELKQYQFNFCSRNYYGFDRVQNALNSGFYEQFARWIKTQDAHGAYPDMPDYCYPESIEVTSSGYILDSAGKNARYQISCRLVYYEEAVQ